MTRSINCEALEVEKRREQRHHAATLLILVSLLTVTSTTATTACKHETSKSGQSEERVLGESQRSRMAQFLIPPKVT